MTKQITIHDRTDNIAEAPIVGASETVCGTINHFIFQDIDSGFVIFTLDHEGQSPDRRPITVKGKLPPLQAGQEVELTGQWVIDRQYGRQFDAVSCRGSLPSSINGLKKFLGSGLIKGIGKVYAERLVERFGQEVLTVIEKQPERLSRVDGLGEKRVASIVASWKEHKEISEIMIFLQDKSISPAFAVRIYKQYRHNTVPIIMNNPYRLAEEVWGVGFKKADEIARNLGFEKNSPFRIAAGILHALLTATQQGHLYVEVDELKKKTHELLELPEDTAHADLITQAITQLSEQNKIKIITRGEHAFAATAKCYHAESGVAQNLKRLAGSTPVSRFNIDEIYRALETGGTSSSITLNQKQIEGILASLQHKVTIITGGPGTGKTTLIKTFLSVLDRYHVRYKLAAPTGRAAKRMAESTGRQAATIHRLLEFDPLSGRFKHDEMNALALDFLIVDEASMIDIFLAYALLRAVPQHAHVLFIGDVDQLPAVGAGNFLNDCIASMTVPCIRLTEVFRQAQDSLIIVNAHRVNRGEFPLFDAPGARHDFLFIKEHDPLTLANHLKSIFFNTLARFHIPPEDAIVLAPMNRGAAGTQCLNGILQGLLNPHKTDQVVFNGTCYKIGDRVMQIRNNYDKFVFNGDTGRIESIDTENRLMKVNFQERILEYDFTELHELVLAYAVSVHKSQGSEYAAVVVPLFMQHFMLLQRNLLYTAITRAKKACILIGEARAAAIALRNSKGIKRTTFLQSFLTEV